MIKLDPVLFGLLMLLSFASGVVYHGLKATREATKGHICSFCFQPVDDDDRWWEQ